MENQIIPQSSVYLHAGPIPIHMQFPIPVDIISTINPIMTITI